MAEVSQSMQLDFHQAMQDFRTMFPDMDADVIEAVLRANRGAVHATIDQLLTIATDVETHRSSLQPPSDRNSGLEGAVNYELPPSYAASATPPPSYHQAVPPSPHRSPGCHTMEDHPDGRTQYSSKHWHPPILLPLPKDFLKIVPPPHCGVSVLSRQRLTERLSENALAREAVGESDVELAQYLKDERIALFLQNDEFVSELRGNQEFMSALQREHDGDADDEDESEFEETQTFRRKSHSKRTDTSGGGVGISLPQLDDATFKERIANMGKASRKKFAQIAKVFSRGKRTGAPRSLLPSVAAGNTDRNGKDLLMCDPLIDDFDEEKSERNVQVSDDGSSTSPKKM